MPTIFLKFTPKTPFNICSNYDWVPIYIYIFVQNLVTFHVEETSAQEDLPYSYHIDVSDLFMHEIC